MEKPVSLRKHFWTRGITPLLLLFLLSQALAGSGNPVPGRWQKVAGLKNGTRIIVHVVDGSRRECLYRGIIDAEGKQVAPDDFKMAGDRIWMGYDESGNDVYASLTGQGFLLFADPDGKRDRVGMDAVRKIILPRTGKYAREWSIWGALGGVVTGIVASAAGRDDPSPEDHFLTGVAGAGIGALIGGISGAAVGSTGETIYISKEAAREGRVSP